MGRGGAAAKLLSYSLSKVSVQASLIVMRGAAPTLRDEQARRVERPVLAVIQRNSRKKANPENMFQMHITLYI